MYTSNVGTKWEPYEDSFAFNALACRDVACSADLIEER
jgi:hypothetical protein